jgi:hypothetical protein
MSIKFNGNKSCIDIESCVSELVEIIILKDMSIAQNVSVRTFRE